MSENNSIYSTVIKRAIDISGASFGLILCAPPMLMIATFIWIKASRPILHQEIRVGLHQKPFQLYKFRSMKSNPDNPGVSVATGDDSRVLSFGHFLRASHLDELPQLYSVLKGDMSLVGPRPYKSSHFEKLPKASHQIIASVKPGLTGSDSLIFIAEDEALKGLENPEAIYLNFFLPEKAKRQIQYIQTQNNYSDLKLILKTVHALFFRKNHQNSVHYLRSLFTHKGKDNPED